MFELKNVEFDYGPKNILNDVNLQIKKGKFLSIIGPNGSGKTTLLNIINGMYDNYNGEVSFLGKNIKSYSIIDKAKYFSIIGQNNNINFPFNCIEIVKMGRNPHNHGISTFGESDYKIVVEAMKKTDTIEFFNSLVTQISGGELQRIVLARALAQTPKVLFLDEAFSAMDIAYKIRLLNVIRKQVEEEGLTVISVNHDINTAYTFSDKICALKKGKIIGYGYTKEIMNEEFINQVYDIKVEKVDDKGFFVKVN